MAKDLWEVVGGADKGGILVRAGRDTKSPELGQRLAFGAVVQQLELHGDRLNYWLVEGTGPETGWVSTKLKDKVLLSKKRDEATDVPMSADRERRANTRKILQLQMESMPYMRAQFQQQIDALDAEDDKEIAAHRGTAAPAAKAPQQRPAPVQSAPPAAKAPQQRLVPVQQPPPKVQPAAPAAQPQQHTVESLLNAAQRAPIAPVVQTNRGAPVSNVVEVVESDEEVEDVPVPSAAALMTALDDEEEVEDVPVPNAAPAGDDALDGPSVEELLARVDRDIDEDAEPEAPPSLEEMLANLERDEKEEAEFEESLKERDRFFDLANVAGTAIAKLTPDPFAHLTADTVSLPNNFTYANLEKFGSMCLAKAKARAKEHDPEYEEKQPSAELAEAG